MRYRIRRIVRWMTWGRCVNRWCFRPIGGLGAVPFGMFQCKKHGAWTAAREAVVQRLTTRGKGEHGTS